MKTLLRWMRRRREAQEALGRAVQNGDAESANVALKQGARPNAKCPGLPYVPLVSAVRLSRPSIDPAALVKVLVERGADVWAVDALGDSVLAQAVKGRYASTVTYLLSQPGGKFCINRPNGRGQTPVHLAAQAGTGEILQALLNAGGNVDAADDHRNTPLHTAASRKGLTVPMVLNAGGNVDAVNVHGQTPLHLACQNLQVKNLTTLLHHGANPNSIDQRGNTPLHEVMTSNSYEENDTVRLFHLGEPSASLPVNRVKHLIMVELLLHGANPLALNQKGNPPDWGRGDNPLREEMQRLRHYTHERAGMTCAADCATSIAHPPMKKNRL